LEEVDMEDKDITDEMKREIRWWHEHIKDSSPRAKLHYAIRFCRYVKHNFCFVWLINEILDDYILSTRNSKEEVHCPTCSQTFTVDTHLDSLNDMAMEYDKSAAEWREQREEIKRLKG